MPLPTVPVTCQAFDQNGDPVAGALVTAVLSRTEIYSGFVAPERVEAEADVNGIAVLNLFPNALGAMGSTYRVTMLNPDTGKRFVDSVVTVPDSPCNLHQILVLEPTPPLDAAEQAILTAQSAVAHATFQAGQALSHANSANGSKTAAQIAAGLAEGYRNSAQGYAQSANSDAQQTALDRIAVEGDALAVSNNTQTVTDKTFLAQGAANTATSKANQAGESALLAQQAAEAAEEDRILFISAYGNLYSLFTDIQTIVVNHHGFGD